MSHQKIKPIHEFNRDILTKLEKVPTNHVLVVDVSGSMYDSLPKMRQHIKNNFALLVKPKDTVSIIYFSSKGEFGVVFENQTISSLKDLNYLQQTVDRFLKPMCLTGFKEPIQEAIELSKRIKNGNINNFIFMTDGYDNQWSESEILKVCEQLPNYYEEITFIEYGWYCNRKLIEKMVEKSNALHIFSENYVQYEESVEKVITNDSMKKVNVEVSGEKVFYYKNDEIISTDVKDGLVSIPEDLQKFYVVDEFYVLDDQPDNVKYTMLYFAINKMDSTEAWEVLKQIGDVKIIKEYGNCFSKQDYSNILAYVKSCIFDESKRYVEGQDFNAVPKMDAYTVIDLLDDLSKDENKLLITSEHFNYSRIGSASKQKSEEEIVNALKEQITKTTDVEEIKTLAEKITQVQENVSFTAEGLENGVSINTLVYNENRPNVSVNTQQFGYVKLPETQFKKYSLPEKFSTTIFRNYTIVKDGIKNVKILPVKLTLKTFSKLVEEGVLSGDYDSNKEYLINLEQIPVINRKMVKELSAKDFFTNYIMLQELKAKQKVLKFFLDKESVSAKFAETYGVEAASYLDNIGIKEYGFSPKVSKEKSGDFYYSKELNLKIEGLSSLPSVNAVIKKVTEGKKLNLADVFMNRYITMYQKEKDNKEFLQKETEKTIQEVRALQLVYNQTMYAIIIGQVWFKEFASVEENTMNVEYEKMNVKCSALLEEKEIEI